MARILVLLLCALLAAQSPAWGQERRSRGDEGQKQSFGPRERGERGEMRRERAEHGSRRSEHRFTREERDKLRQDINDANRDMRRK